MSAFDNYLPIYCPPQPANRGVKCRATSVAEKGKYSMENFTQMSMLNLTQFEAIICAKHNTQWQSNKWKIMTLF